MASFSFYFTRKIMATERLGKFKKTLKDLPCTIGKPKQEKSKCWKFTISGSLKELATVKEKLIASGYRTFSSGWQITT